MMKSKLKKWLRPFLFTIGGALVGIGYYYVVGVVGLLLSGIFGKGCDGKCNM